MVVSNFHEAEKSHSSRMKSILETPVSLFPPDHLAPRTESSVSLLADHATIRMLRSGANSCRASSPGTCRSSCWTSRRHDRRPRASHDLQPDRPLILLLIGSASDDPADAIRACNDRPVTGHGPREPSYARWPSRGYWPARTALHHTTDCRVQRSLVSPSRCCSRLRPLAHSWFDIAESALARAASELNQAAAAGGDRAGQPCAPQHRHGTAARGRSCRSCAGPASSTISWSS